MSENKQRDALIAISGLILLLAALGVNIYNKIALEGLRPTASLQEAPAKVRARLWQDPFAAVLAHIQSGMAEKEILATEVCQLKGQPEFVLQEPVTKGALRQRIADTVKGGKITILGIMVVGSPYAEDVEARLRQRLAVLAALERLGYIPESAEYLNFIRLTTVDKPLSRKIRLRNILPYEWLQKERAPDNNLLLLWLNEDSFDEQPLARLACLWRYLEGPAAGRQRHKIDFIVVGPPTSGSLEAMLQELWQAEADAQFPKGLRLYAAGTTIPNYLLFPLRVDPHFMATAEQWLPIEQQAAINIRNLFWEAGGIVFARTIATDQEMADLLLKELQNRGLDVAGTGQNGEHRDQIVLISEYDTFYGRALPEIFVQGLRQKHNAGRREDDPTYYPGDKPLPWVLRYTYLRGLDGVMVDAQEGAAASSAGGSKKDEAKKLRLEEPMGPSQFDYLRRLADTIYQQHEQLWRENKQEIRAIGILGNDFYDKYLVLQALKQRFPDALFFTTDLDARYTHEMYNDWTRNLLVASGYGLTLPPEIQKDVPPFRDAYQTAVFLTVLQALGGEAVCPIPEEKFPRFEPRLFEIGRTQAVDLAQPVGGAFHWRPLMMVSLSLLAFFGMVWFGCGISRKNTWHSGFLLITWTCLAVIILFWHHHASHNPAEEPWFLLEGVSVLPTNLLRVLATFGSLFFLIHGWSNLRHNARELADDFDLDPPLPYSGNAKDTKRSWWSYFWGYSCHLPPAAANPEEFPVRDRWHGYIMSSRGGWMALRMIILLLLWGALSSFLIHHFGIPHDPVRGPMSSQLHLIIKVAAIISSLVLNFFVFDASRLFRNFTLQAANHQPTWSLASYRKVLGESARPDTAFAEWMFVRFIAQRSEVIIRLIYYPFLIFFLLLASRWSTFDNWRLPIGLAVVISLSLVLAWSCALMLRRGAEKVRGQIIQRLTHELVQQQAAQGVDAARVANLRFILEEVKSIRQGAFTPFLQNPVVQALFVPFGGIGGLTLLDFLNKLT